MDAVTSPAWEPSAHVESEDLTYRVQPYNRFTDCNESDSTSANIVRSLIEIVRLCPVYFYTRDNRTQAVAQVVNIERTNFALRILCDALSKNETSGAPNQNLEDKESSDEQLFIPAAEKHLLVHGNFYGTLEGTFCAFSRCIR